MSFRILVVEDDPANALLTLAILRAEHGLEAVLARSGAEVLELASSVDLVLMDVSLKGFEIAGRSVDGLELCRRLRRLQKALPVVLLTAHAMAGDRERLLRDSGAVDYHAKPIEDPGALIGRIRRHLAAD